jgi:hypothetical protein
MVGTASLDRTNFTTYYFRNRFLLPANSGEGSIRLSHVTDSGVIWYLNGQEIYRFNLPDGKVDSFTTASAEVGVQCRDVTSIPVTNLRTGTNVLAAEVHQSTEGVDVTLYYGVQMDALFIKEAPRAPQFGRDAFIKLETNRVVVTWDTNKFPGAKLEQSTNIRTNQQMEPWTVISTTSPYRTTPLSRTNRFYRLNAPALSQ